MAMGKFRNAGWVLASVAVATVPVAVLSAPRMIQISPDGSTSDITQAKGKRNTGTTDPILTDPVSTDPGLTTDTGSVGTVGGTATSSSYYPTLNPTYTDSQIGWMGRDWRVNAASTKYPNLPYSLMHSAQWKRLRFEVRSSDPSMEDKPEKRRSELSGSVYGDKTRLPNGVSLWGAFSTLQRPWADPEGMKSTYGAVFGQIHMGSKVGGSPAVAFRRIKTGKFRITSRGEFDDAGSTLYEGSLSFDQVHDVVYNVVLHPTNGSLRVWVDGVQIVNVPKASIGHTLADSYWNVGLYAPGGVTSPVVTELANHVYPSTTSLAARTTQAPSWPRD